MLCHIYRRRKLLLLCAKRRSRRKSIYKAMFTSHGPTAFVQTKQSAGGVPDGTELVVIAESQLLPEHIAEVAVSDNAEALRFAKLAAECWSQPRSWPPRSWPVPR